MSLSSNFYYTRPKVGSTFSSTFWGVSLGLVTWLLFLLPDLLVAPLTGTLFTNRPDSEAAKHFNKSDRLTSFQFSQAVALAMGIRIGVQDVDPKVFYVNLAAAFARGGYMKITRLGNDKYSVEKIYSSNKNTNKSEVQFNLPTR